MKITLAPSSLKMILASLETVIAAYFKVLFVFLFKKFVFMSFYKSSGSELSTMSSTKIHPPAAPVTTF